MKGIKQVDDPEITLNLRTMVTAVTELSISVKTLVESDIRRQEREASQLEFNNFVRRELREIRDHELKQIKKWQTKLDLERARESHGRNFLTKYWWAIILALVISYPSIMTLIGKLKI